jgi:hypothetical protein
VARRPVDDGAVPWPRELWTFDPKRWRCRYEWLDAAVAFAKLHGYNPLPIIRLYVNRRPLGTELATVLPEGCRHLVRSRRNGSS